MKEEQLSPLYSENKGSVRLNSLTEMHNVVGEVRVLQGNGTNRMGIERGIYFKELAHVLLEDGKPKNLQDRPAGWGL